MNGAVVFVERRTCSKQYLRTENLRLNNFDRKRKCQTHFNCMRNIEMFLIYFSCVRVLNIKIFFLYFC